MMVATFTANDPGGAASSFQLVSDNSTVLSLVDDLSANCSSYLKPSSASDTSSRIDVSPYMDSKNSLPRPESII
ncbi:hypothetical protein BJ165DRAFT_1417772 [Panaeolus papilionaceus]|nr:hypothetical protein BJ165DRAFT_1417772 [Panaeolus papilionaceus]